MTNKYIKVKFKKVIHNISNFKLHSHLTKFTKNNIKVKQKNNKIKNP